VPWQNGAKGDWNRPRQTDLTTVGMSTQKEIEAGMCGLAVNFGRMRQQYRKPIAWNFGRCLFDVIHPIIVGIVDAGEVDAFITARNWIALVEQYADSHFFKFGNHTGQACSVCPASFSLTRSCGGIERGFGPIGAGNLTADQAGPELAVSCASSFAG